MIYKDWRMREGFHVFKNPDKETCKAAYGNHSPLLSQMKREES